MDSNLRTPRISVVLSSFNGADSLPNCLSALAAVARPEGGVEFLFVDNASEDDTAALLRAAAEATGGLFLSEPRRGKSFALNTAIRKARGRYVVFMDDDIVASEDWLMAYAAAADTHPDCGIFAGQVRPHWSGQPPAWLVELTDMGLACGCTPVARAAGPCDANQVKGGNVMIRLQLLEARSFDTEGVNFGSASAPTGGEDTKLMMDFAQAGEPILYCPSARVGHILLEKESTLQFLLHRQVRIGRSAAQVNGIAAADAMKHLLAIPVYAVLSAGLFGLRRRRASIQQVMKIASRVGQLQVWRQRRASAPARGHA